MIPSEIDMVTHQTSMVDQDVESGIQKLSESFQAGHGVHQGAPWSSYLFQRSYNDLLKLKCRNAKIFNLETGNPAYADDLSVVSLHKPLLQYQLDKIYTYSKKWRFKFNPHKSVIMIFGENSSPDIPITLGGREIKVKQSGEHMGIYIGYDRESEQQFIKNRIQKGRKAFFAAQGIGSRTVPLPPMSASKVYWSVCVPRMLHGLEIMPLSTPNLEQLEQAHHSMAKMVQGLPPQTANVASLAPLGWRSISSHIDFLKMLFLWRILLLPVDNIYKKVALLRLWFHVYHSNTGIHSGPLHDIVNVFMKYGLLHMLDNVLKYGTCMSMATFKKLCKEKVDSYELDSFKISCSLYKSLSLYRNVITKIDVWAWWRHLQLFPQDAFKVRIVGRMLSGQNCLMECCARYTDASTICQLCTQYSVETVPHLLFDCCAFNELRQQLWSQVLVTVPAGMRHELGRMSSTEKTVFIVSCLHGTYISEWCELYRMLLKFCSKMYQHRREAEV